MRKLFLLPLLLLLLPFFSLAQDNDTTQYLFKNLNYSYMQYTIGYERMSFGAHDNLNGMTLTILGAAFGNKIALGADVDIANHAKTTFLPGETYPQTASYIAASLTIEPLIIPKKLINFSIPIKIGFANAARWDTAMDYSSPWIAGFSSSALGYQVNEYSDNFVVASAGANAFVNLWKPLSLGVGVSYRYSIATRKSNHADIYSGLSTFIVLRWKFDTKAYYKKALERQQEYLRKMQTPAGS